MLISARMRVVSMSRISEIVRKYRATVAAQQEKIESLRVELNLGRNQVDKTERMLTIAWSAIIEAGYEGYSNELKEYMEND